MQQPTKVNAPDTIQLLSRLIDDAVDEASATIKVSWLKERGWVAFPVPDDYYEPWEPDPEVRNVMAAVEALGIEKFLAANVDFPATYPDFAWETRATLEGFMGISEELRPYLFIVTDPAVSFLVYCTKSEYHIIAGPPPFVLQSLGGDIEEAKADFVEQAATVWGGSDEKYLLDVLDEYEDLLAASGYPLKTPKVKRRKTIWYISIHPKGADEEIDVIPMGRSFGLYGVQAAFGRDRSDPMTGKIPIQEENLELAWAPYHPFDFDKFDYYLMSYEP